MSRHSENQEKAMEAGDGDQIDRLAAMRICVELKMATQAIVTALRVMRERGGAAAHVRLFEVAHMLELASAFSHAYALATRKKETDAA